MLGIKEITSFFMEQGLNEQLASIVTYLVEVLTIFIICFIIDKITKRILLNVIEKIVVKTTNTFDEILFKRKVFHNLAHLSPALIVLVFTDQLPFNTWIKQLTYVYILFIVSLILFRALDSIVEVYNTKKFAKERPIKGVIQVIKIILTIFMITCTIAIFVNTTTALALLSSFGGLSAIIILVFKDSILGFVAGIQLSLNNLLKIGDWIEMSQYGADGEVVDISLTKITVRNWDKTFTNIPAYKFIDDAFKNWEGMSRSGGRRIKRAIYIDVNTIKFLDEAMIDKLSTIELLKDYINNKLNEVTIDNDNNEENITNIVNGKRLTNIGTFRVYMQEYLKANPYIHNNFPIMIRQLPQTDKGLPLEVYCFSNDTVWAHYEVIQADIFDHLLAITNEFGLKLYQSPAGSDFAKLYKD